MDDMVVRRGFWSRLLGLGAHLRGLLARLFDRERRIAEAEARYRCGTCGARGWSNSDHCDECHAKFEMASW